MRHVFCRTNFDRAKPLRTITAISLFAVMGSSLSLLSFGQNANQGNQSSQSSASLQKAKNLIDTTANKVSRIATSQQDRSHSAKEVQKTMEGADKELVKLKGQLTADQLDDLKKYEAGKAQELSKEDTFKALNGISEMLKSVNFTYADIAPVSEPSQNMSIDCGFYGPYHAEISCPAHHYHANCWCDKSILGWGVAKCECDAGAATAATTPPPAGQRCGIDRSPYSCLLKKPGDPDNAAYPYLQGTDPGCTANCANGFTPICNHNRCEDGTYTPSSCGCEPK